MPSNLLTGKGKSFFPIQAHRFGGVRGMTAGLIALCAGGGATAGDSGLPRIDWEFWGDLRLSATSGEPGWLDGGFGKGRYGGRLNGDRDDGIVRGEVAQASILAKPVLAWGLTGLVHVKYDQVQDKPADLVEAFLRYRPAPSSNLSWSAKAGLYFLPVSRENTGPAWSSPYTISFSALNSWIGEEGKVVGAELRGTWRSGGHRLSATGGVFGFNDPIGSLIAWRGWALHDHIPGAFSTVPLPPVPSISEGGFFEIQPDYVNPVKEVDNRPGYYVALDYDFDRRFRLGFFYHDNRGEPTTFRDGQYSWDTRFWVATAEANLPGDVRVIAQHSQGNTQMGKPYFGRQPLDTDFGAGYVLVTRPFGAARISGRIDWFDTDDRILIVRDNNEEVGYAATLAAGIPVTRHVGVMAEWLYINSDRHGRRYLGLAEEQDQHLVQVSLRLHF